MERWENKIAVVTGSSSGIGAQVAKDLIKSKVIVVGLARRVEKLELLKNEIPKQFQSFFHPIKCDVKNETEVHQAFDWIKQNLGGIDILINNAGIVRFGPLPTISTQDLRDVMDTNVMGIVYCTQEAVKSMQERNVDGHIIMINSILGHKIPSGLFDKVPSLNMYPPSKFAVTAMTEILKQDLSNMGNKIRVTNISPGLVQTEIVLEELLKLKPPILQPEDISNAILYILGTPPHVQISELTIQPVGEKF